MVVAGEVNGVFSIHDGYPTLSTALPPSTRAELRQLLKHGTPHRLQGAPEALFFPNDSDSDAGFD